jgi:hypothetical protein
MPVWSYRQHQTARISCPAWLGRAGWAPCETLLRSVRSGRCWRLMTTVSPSLTTTRPATPLFGCGWVPKGSVNHTLGAPLIWRARNLLTVLWRGEHSSGLSSAHQSGACAIVHSDARSACNATGRLHIRVLAWTPPALVADDVRAVAQRKVYDDSDGQRKDEIASMAGSNVFAGFYDRVKELKEYHRRHPNSGFTEKEDLSYMISEQPWVDFTGEVRPSALAAVGARCAARAGKRAERAARSS